ncbi:MAG: S9 family peptidase [Candidatus Eremiobacteraeota bacterium]|nr:S9 family peptidase [Candidatus Eremiobacteraeota bacterium]
MRVVFRLSLFVLIGALAVPASAFDFSDARRLVTISDPQISPDGSRVVFLRSTSNFETDKRESRLMLVDVRSRRERPLTFDRKGVGLPHWSADGRSIAFVALDDDEKNPQTQIFVMRMDGGDARQVTHAKNGIDNYAWSPDATRFAYATQDDDPSQKAVDEHHDAFEVRDNDYLHRSATPPEHAWWIAQGGGTPHRLTSGSWSIGDIDPDGGSDLSWSADGRSLAIEHLPTPFVGDSLESRIEIIDVASRRRRLLDGKNVENAPGFAPHGDRIAYVRNTGGDYTRGIDLYVADDAGKIISDLRTDLDRNIDGYSWNAKGDGLWIATPDRTDSALWYRPLAGHTRRIRLGALQITGLGNAANNGALIFTADTPAHPGELYMYDGVHAIALTDDNVFAGRTGVAKTVAVNWNSTKGHFNEDGALTYPLNYRGGKAPLVLLIHGGPQGASGIGWNAQRQIFASHGYFVFSPNYRGSTNLGDAYQRAITNDAGDGPGKDVMAGVAQVEKMGMVDTSRIGVSGWSYGGYMTSWLIGHYHVWKAAVSGASLDDWFDDFNLAFYVYTDVPFFRGVAPNPKYSQEWRDQSPITYAHLVTTPTLIMGDIGDNNVVITNSFKLYHAIKDNGTTVQFVAYPVAGHFPSDPVRSEDVDKRWLSWLDRYLK